MPLTPAQLDAVHRLRGAHADRVPVDPVRDVLGTHDVAGAYAVQAEVNRLRAAAGARVVGRKIGLTSRAVQQQLGVDQPDFGVLFDDMEHAHETRISTHDLIQPKVEAEVAFVLGSDLTGDLDLQTVRAAVGQVVAALEIVDSRVADWDITIIDTVADNGSSAAFVLGPQRVDLASVEPREVQMTLRVDDEVVSVGNGAACLGDPLEALTWLARTAQELGDPLLAGQVVLAGALGPMVTLTPGSTVRADISGLGSVAVHVEEEQA